MVSPPWVRSTVICSPVRVPIGGDLLLSAGQRQPLLAAPTGNVTIDAGRVDRHPSPSLALLDRLERIPDGDAAGKLVVPPLAGRGKHVTTPELCLEVPSVAGPRPSTQHGLLGRDRRSARLLRLLLQLLGGPERIDQREAETFLDRLALALGPSEQLSRLVDSDAQVLALPLPRLVCRAPQPGRFAVRVLVALANRFVEAFAGSGEPLGRLHQLVVAAVSTELAPLFADALPPLDRFGERLLVRRQMDRARLRGRGPLDGGRVTLEPAGDQGMTGTELLTSGEVQLERASSPLVLLSLRQRGPLVLGHASRVDDRPRVRSTCWPWTCSRSSSSAST